MVTKEQAEALIERLADKKKKITCPDCSGDSGNTYCHDCDKEWRGFAPWVGQPIILTDVLEKLLMVDYDRLRLVILWEDCGPSNSLQQILEEAEWEYVGAIVPVHPSMLEEMKAMLGTEYMKGPAAELFSYLSSLFPET